MITDKKKIIFYFFLISLLFKPLWLFEYSSIEDTGDDVSYWLHSATLAFDQDINYINDFQSEIVLVNKDTNSPIHYPGSGYLSSPFVFIFSFIDNLLDQEFDRLNPTGTFSYLGYFFSTLFYCYLGFYLIYKLIQLKGLLLDKNFVLIGFLGTLVHFVVTRFLMSHSVEFFLCAALLFLFETRKNFDKQTDMILLTVTFFLLLITRPSTFIYSLVLFLIYKKKFKISKIYKQYVWLSVLAFIIFLYRFISFKLYSTQYFLINNYGNQGVWKADSLNFDTYFDGLLKIPNLFFSFNMGLVWSMPIIIFAIFGLFKNFKNFEHKFLIFIYFSGAFSVLIIWQGREIAYGQRLLIGVIPLCLLLISKTNFKFKKIYLLFSIWTYLGYLYLYSSKLLTLTSGKTLWGTEVGFTTPNYFINLSKNIINADNIGYILFKNIYSINFLNIFGLDVVPKNIINIIPQNLLLKVNAYAEIYQNIDLYYLMLTNLLIITFSLSFAYLLVKKFKV